MKDKMIPFKAQQGTFEMNIICSSNNQNSLDNWGLDKCGSIESLCVTPCYLGCQPQSWVHHAGTSWFAWRMDS